MSWLTKLPYNSGSFGLLFFFIGDHPFKTSALFRSKIGQICQRIVVKNSRQEEGRGQNRVKFADVLYGWSLQYSKLYQSIRMNKS